MKRHFPGIYCEEHARFPEGGGGMKRRAAVRSATAGKLVAIRVSVDDVYGAMVGARLEHDADLAWLAGSIARHGLLQPIVVRRNAQMGRYALVCGARRLAACRMLGMKEIDALLLDADEQEAAACFFEEHLTHAPPHFLEEAAVLERFGVKQVAACCTLGEEALLRRHRMLALAQETRRLTENGSLTLEQAEPLLHIEDPARQAEAASIIAARQLTPMQAHRLVFGAKRRAQGPAQGRRRAVREAMEEANAMVGRMRAQGIAASVAVHSQEGGLCIQILLQSKEKTQIGQETARIREN